MALGVRLSTTFANSLNSGSIYFSQEPLLIYLEAFDTVTNDVVPDSTTLKHLFELDVTLGGEFVGTYFLPYTPGESVCEVDFQEIADAWYSEFINTNIAYAEDPDDIKELEISVTAYQTNLSTKVITTSATETIPLGEIVFGGENLYQRTYNQPNLNNDLDYREYVIEDPVADEFQNKKFLTKKPQGACRADNSAANIILSGSTNPVESLTWFPGDFSSDTEWQSEFSLEAPETQSAAWQFNDGISVWELPNGSTWGTGEQTSILTWYPGEGVYNALYTGDSGSISVSGEFLTAGLGVSEITWNFVGIIDIDSPWEYDILDSNTFDVAIDPLPVTQMQFNFDATKNYQAIGFFASSPGIGPFSQTDDIIFNVVDNQNLFRDAYWLKTSYIGFDYYTTLSNLRGNIRIFLGEESGLTPGVDYCVQIVNNDFNPLSEQYCNKTCCSELRKYPKADLVFLGQLGSYEGARFYLATGVKQAVNEPISNIRNPFFTTNYQTRNLRQLGDYTTRSWTLITDYVSPAEVEWLQTIASSKDVLIRLPGDTVGQVAQYRPVIVTSLESEMHLFNRDLYQFTITVQDANYNKR